MMRRILCAALSLMLLLAALPAGAEEPAGEVWTGKTADITVMLPEGLTAEDASFDDVMFLQITRDGDESVYYVLTIAQDEQFAGKSMADLGEEEREALIAQYIGEEMEYELAYVEQDGQTFAILADEAATELYLIGLQDGWTCSVIALAEAGVTLDETATDTALAIAGGILLPIAQEPLA